MEILVIVEEKEDLNRIVICNVGIGYERLTEVVLDRIETEIDCDKNISQFWI